MRSVLCFIMCKLSMCAEIFLFFVNMFYMLLSVHGSDSADNVKKHCLGNKICESS